MHDCGPDGSAAVIRELAAEHDWVAPVWLSRNFGQHAATLAGMASSGGDWIVTMDEDGQHDPADIGAMLDTAMTRAGRRRLRRARPTSRRTAALRNARLARRQAARRPARPGRRRQRRSTATGWCSARSAAASRPTPAPGSTSTSRSAGSPATPPPARSSCASEGDRPSGYRLRTLLSHFWRMVLTSGTRLLRLVSVLGVVVRAARRCCSPLVARLGRLTGGDAGRRAGPR